MEILHREAFISLHNLGSKPIRSAELVYRVMYNWGFGGYELKFV